MKTFRLLVVMSAFVCSSVCLSATTPVTGSVKGLNTAAQTSRTFVRFTLAGCSSGQPRVIGTAVIANFGTGTWQQDFTPDGTGAITGTLYSTRDATGLLGGEIDCNGSTTAVFYNMYVCSNGVCGHAVPVHAKNGVALDISSVSPISVTPVVTAPSGDSTYCRLDGTNCGFTGPITGTTSTFATDAITNSGKFTETTAPGCLAGFDFLFGDSTAHRLKQCDNNGSPLQLVNAGVDINTSDQVTATHLSAALPVLQGGTGVTAAQGNGTKVQLSTGATVNGDFASYDANGNTVDSAKAIPAGAVLGTTDTQALTNKTLTGASTGNNVSVLNAQGAVGPQTGNSSDQVLYTYTLPANTVDTTSKGIRIRASAVHSSGTVNTNFKLNVNGVNVANLGSGTSASQSISIDTQLLRTASTTAGTWGIVAGPSANTAAFSIAVTGLAWTSNQTITMTFNVTNTDTWSGIMFMVEQVQ